MCHLIRPLHRLLLLILVTCGPALAVAAAPPQLMLASTWNGQGQVSAYRVSEKLDGVRARWDGRQLWSRSGHRIDAPPWFVAGWPALPLDGELWAGRGRFDEASAIVRRGRASDLHWRQLRFMVFDAPAAAGGFDARLRLLRQQVEAAGVPWLQAIAQHQHADNAALQRHLREVIAGGGEGLMLHHHDGHYRPGRSDTLFKLKPWDDAEARVVAHLPGKGKYQGMLGALLVEDGDGRRFRLGSGFKDAQRAAPPPIGSQVSYRYNGRTSTGLPRFARFLRVRDESTASTPTQPPSPTR